MKNYLFALLCLTLAACQSKPAEMKQDEPFDLAKLTLRENLPNLMAAQKIKPESKDSGDETMFGFEVFKSSSPRLLRFARTGFSGHKNHVLFHFSEEQKTLAGYKLILYDQAQTDTLINLLGKLGTPIFKRTQSPKGSMELDENGNEVKSGNSDRKTYRVFENKGSGLTYFLGETGSDKNLTTELIVLNRSTQFGKDWIASSQLDWYKNEQSEPL